MSFFKDFLQSSKFTKKTQHCHSDLSNRVKYLESEMKLFVELIQKHQTQIIKNMAALDTLLANVTALTATVDEVVTVLNTPHPTEVQVEAAADAVASQIERLHTALGVKSVAPAAPAAASPSAV